MPNTATHTERHLLATVRSYFQAIPDIITFQIFTGIILALCYALLRKVSAWALASQGRVAVTTGDFAFLFTSWQGILLLVLAVLTVYLSITFDLNVRVAFAGRWVRGQDVRIRHLLWDGLGATRRMLCPEGMLVALYIAVLAPLLGVGLSISLTEGLSIPTFISSVIDATPLYHAAYTVFVAVFSILGFLGVFIVHGVVLDGLPVREAMGRSRSIVRAHWLNYLLQTLKFTVLAALAAVIVGALLLIAGLLAIRVLVDGQSAIIASLSGIESSRFLLLLIASIVLVLIICVALLSGTFLAIKMTKLYLAYTTEEEVCVPKRPHRMHPFLMAGTLILIVLAVGASYVAAKDFDEIFPLTSDVRIIAHRAAGVEGPENCVAGLEAAKEAGAWGAEIDIQRTADGAYVVNHDGSFERVAGDSRKPSEMTLEEVRQLAVQANPADPEAPAQQVATYEEMLEASRDSLMLFVELKGSTADQQMADDAVRIAREHGMLDQCVFISLQYDIVDYIESAYPDAQTGFLAFASHGDVAALNCDYLALEELSATRDAIAAIHEQGKQALVWTVNEVDSQRYFLCTEADAIITDYMSQAEEVRAELARRDDIARVIDGISVLIG